MTIGVDGIIARIDEIVTRVDGIATRRLVE